MFIGAYLCTAGLVTGAGTLIVVWLNDRRRISDKTTIQIRRYLLYSGSLILVALVLFVAISIILGVLHTGGAASWSYPQDYLERGPVEWIVMLLPILGIFSPIILLYLAESKR